MTRPIRKCPKTGVYCSLYNVDGHECLAETAYDNLLTCFYPHIATLPFGMDSLKARTEIAKTLCRFVRSRNARIRKELAAL